MGLRLHYLIITYAPSEACNIQLVKIQPEESVAYASEQTLASGRATYLREAKRDGYRAAKQVKGLSPESHHCVGVRYCSLRIRQHSINQYWQGYASPTGLRPWHYIKRILQQLGRSETFFNI